VSLKMRSESTTKIGGQIASTTPCGDTVAKYPDRIPVKLCGQGRKSTVFDLANSLRQLGRFYLVNRSLAEYGKDIGIKTAIHVLSVVRNADVSNPLQCYRF